MSRAAGALALGAALAALALLALLTFSGALRDGMADPAPAHAAPQAEGSAQRAAPVTAPPPALLPAPAPALARAPSLAGTELDGAWPLDALGRLQPQRALRLRFDHLLTQLGERPLPAVRAQLAQLAAQDGLSAPAQAELLALFDRYTTLLQWPWQQRADRLLPHTWPAALAERQRVRRELLGAAWAAAFYPDDEPAALGVPLAAATPPLAPPAPPLHPDAAAREALLAAQWQDWERRLDAARQQAAALQQAPELSPPQREAALTQHLAAHFSADEQPRVRALLGI